MPSTAGRDPGLDTRPRTALGTDCHLLYTPLTPSLDLPLSRLARGDTTRLSPREEIAREPRDRSWPYSGHPRGESFRAPEDRRPRARRTRCNVLPPARSAARPRRELCLATSCGPRFPR